MFRKLHSFNSQGRTLTIDGAPVAIEPGETVAAAMLRQTEPWCRLNPELGDKRAPYCMMGACFECLAEVDGVPSVQTCLTPAREGMRVVRQTKRVLR